MAFEIVEIQPTPNPNALKFMLNGQISDQTLSFLTPEAAAHHPLAHAFFGINGVISILLLHDFITINKSPSAKWPDIKKQVKKVISTKT